MRQFFNRLATWPLYVLGFVLMIWQFWSALSGRSGPEPVKWLENAYGETALYLLLAGLAITPLWQGANINLVKFRRPIGLMAFFFVLAHFVVWFALDVQFANQIMADIIKRPYITVGFVALILMVPLAITSNNRSLRTLGPKRWKRLHKLTYPICVLAVIHYVMQAKVLTYSHYIFIIAFASLLLWRLIRSNRRRMA